MLFLVVVVVVVVVVVLVSVVLLSVFTTGRSRRLLINKTGIR